MNNTASALSAQRLRMDVISSNMANVDSTRANYVNGEWQPYKRKSVVLQPKEGQFSNFLNVAMNKSSDGSVGNGVKVTKIVEDETPFKLVYNPEHPDYEANVTVFNASKGMMMKALEIGK